MNINCLHTNEVADRQEISMGENLLGKQVYTYIQVLKCTNPLCGEKRRKRISKEEYEEAL